jgi:hypothetical protein
VTVVYGSATAPWSMLVDAARWESRNRSALSPVYGGTSVNLPHEYSAVLTYFSRIILDIERIRSNWKDGELSSLLPLLRQFSGRKASDDRDKVFALLGLVRSECLVVPNYLLDIPKVFETTALSIVKTMGSLAVLAGDLGRKDRQDLPSWVPDWSAS